MMGSSNTPQCVDVEAAVIHICLHDPSKLTEVRASVAPADFFHRPFGLVFQAALDVYDRGNLVDGISLVACLEAMGRFEQVGHECIRELYLRETAQFSANYDAAPEYAQQIKRMSVARRFAHLCDEMQARVRIRPDDLVALHSQFEGRLGEMRRELSKVVGDAYQTPREVMRDLAEVAKARAKGPEIPTGLLDLDRRTFGLQRGDLTVLAARTSMGKSALAVTIAKHVARQHRVLYFSLEMPNHQLGARIISLMSGISVQQVMAVQNPVRMQDAVKEFSGLDMHFYQHTRDIPGIIAQIRDEAMQLAEQEKCIGLVIVDHVGLVKHLKADRHDLALGATTMALKEAAKEFELPVMALCQINRGCENRDNKRPNMSDLRDSGRLEEDADNIWLLYRDEYYNGEESKAKGIAELEIAKGRNCGTHLVKLAFRDTSASFHNLLEAI